jgi:hypothetical protein
MLSLAPRPAERLSGLAMAGPLLSAIASVAVPVAGFSLNEDEPAG